jgi:hypothetical protein
VDSPSLSFLIADNHRGRLGVDSGISVASGRRVAGFGQSGRSAGQVALDIAAILLTLDGP